MKTKNLEEVKSFLVSSFAKTQESPATPGKIREIRIIVDEAIIYVKDKYEELEKSLKEKDVSKYTPSEKEDFKHFAKLHKIISKTDITKSDASTLRSAISYFASLVKHRADARSEVITNLKVSWGKRFDTSSIERTYDTAIETLKKSDKWAYVLNKSYLFHDAIDTIHSYANDLLLRTSSFEKTSPREQLVQRSIGAIA